ncbi:response regulator [Flavobacterium procerum]|uniref:Response regulator n=1 Tax=Flavobacterium procerum TaxID=1455569 RepID=A0ABV6BVR4_9FLAO
MRYKNILLVDHTDDSKLLMTAIKAVDEKINSTIENNALQVLRKLNETNNFPDLIFIDYHMPYIEGSEFLELLRSIKGLKKIPIVFYSAHSFEAVKNAVKKHKEVWCINKQNNLSMITKSLKEIINC